MTIHRTETAPSNASLDDLWLDPNAEPAPAGEVDDQQIRDVVIDQLVAGQNVTLDKSPTQIKINSTAGTGNVSSTGQKYLIPLRSEFSPSLNAQAVRDGTRIAHSQGRDCEFPPGLFMCDHNPFLPDGNMPRMSWWGQGAGHTRLRFPDTSTEKWWYKDDAAIRLHYVSWHHMSLEAGPRDSKEQRLKYYPQAKGFRFQGQPEQKFIFDNVDIANLATVLELKGDNNASEVTWSDCEWYSIFDNGIVFDNHQALNIGFRNSHVEGMFGNCFNFINADRPVWGGGGAITIQGGNFLIQHYAEHQGVMFNIDAHCSATILVQTRVEVRDDAMLVRQSGSNPCNIVFHGGSAYTTYTTGDVKVCDIGAGARVTHDNWVMENNGSRPTWRVRSGGLLRYIDSPVRGDLKECITVESGGRAEGRNNAVRYTNAAYPDFTK